MAKVLRDFCCRTTLHASVDKKEGCTSLMVLRGEITEANVSTVLSKRSRQSCEMEKHQQRI